ncbi:MAG TPA: class I SAM-dependent methyltransferase [Syntrophorhabdaceae bacterium]|mgnify:CR=1 FL=1|nr:class I SAM-dependent methyltransferase [Syntrophorhabdaceae bacterium]HQM80942.1 class I SAM-dependent methyltransferase [Syntrophorhabdaceae bacterium]
MKNRYTTVHYNENLRPYTQYPEKLCNHLADRYFRRRSGRLLDLCCGRGEHMELFQKIGFDVYGIDMDTVGRDKGLNVAVADIEHEAFPFEDNFFDVIMMKSAIEHIRNIDHVMSEVYRVLKHGGSFLATTCDWKKNYKVFYDDYTHKTPFTKASMEDMFKMFDFRNFFVEHFYHLPFTWKGPFYKSLTRFFALMPLKYTQTTELTEFKKLIRFSKEVQLLGYAEK